MAVRAFHSVLFYKALHKYDLFPIYFISNEALLDNASENKRKYEILKIIEHDKLYQSRIVSRFCAKARHFAVKTSTTDLRFREDIEQSITTEKSIFRISSESLLYDLIRHIPNIGKILLLLETNLTKTNIYNDSFRKNKIELILTPAMGNNGFLHEGIIAREAKRYKIKTLSAISNYDNIVNKGYPGYFSDKIAVWSKSMADDVIHLFHFPSKKIEITGPVPFDHYYKELLMNKKEFIESKGLSPEKNTVLYMGGVNVTRYFEILKFFRKLSTSNDNMPFNLIIRMVPHAKVLVSPAMDLFQEICKKHNWIYVSNPLAESPDVMEQFHMGLLNSSEEYDELHYLFKYSDVMINHYSTASLEAAILDLPSIFVGYDNYTYGQKYAFSSLFQQRQAHNNKKKRINASAKAQDEKELLLWIERYINNPMIHKSERFSYALSECEFLDGKSGERLSQLIDSLLK